MFLGAMLVFMQGCPSAPDQHDPIKPPNVGVSSDSLIDEALHQAARLFRR
jgi:hypothetical protein